MYPSLAFLPPVTHRTVQKYLFLIPPVKPEYLNQSTSPLNLYRITDEAPLLSLSSYDRRYLYRTIVHCPGPYGSGKAELIVVACFPVAAT